MERAVPNIPADDLVSKVVRGCAGIRWLRIRSTSAPFDASVVGTAAAARDG